jgi:hypothetical protein
MQVQLFDRLGNYEGLATLPDILPQLPDAIVISGGAKIYVLQNGSYMLAFARFVNQSDIIPIPPPVPS